MIVVFLGFLAAAGSFSASLMSPVLDLAADRFDTGTGVLAGLVATLFQLAFGLGHLWWGWRADVQGRLPVLWLGIASFAAGALMCLVPVLPVLMSGRVLMGFGAAATLVVSRAMIRDLFDGPDYGRAMTNLTMVFALIPGLAPALGIAAGGIAGWDGVVLAMAGYGVGMGICVRLTIDRAAVRRRLPEPAAVSFAGAYRPIVSSRAFRYYAGIAALAIAPMFLFYSVAATAYSRNLGVGPEAVTIHVLIVTVAAYLLGGEIQKTLAPRLDVTRQLATGVVLCCAGCFGAAAVSLAGAAGPWLWTACFSIYSMGLAFALPGGTREAIGLFPGSAGAASATAGMSLMVAPAIGTTAFALLESMQAAAPLPLAMAMMAAGLALWFAAGLRKSQPIAAAPAQASETRDMT